MGGRGSVNVNGTTTKGLSSVRKDFLLGSRENFQMVMTVKP